MALVTAVVGTAMVMEEVAGEEVVAMAVVEVGVGVCSISSLDTAAPHHAQYAWVSRPRFARFDSDWILEERISRSHEEGSFSVYHPDK